LSSYKGNNIKIHSDYNSIRSNDLKGGNNQKWKIEIKKLSKNIEKPAQKKGIFMEAKLDVILKDYNRLNCPLFLNPQISSFIDVAIHAKLRQRLSNSTIEKHLRYARFMETHTCPVDLRNPDFNNFIRHMDWREQIEKASANALTHEWKAIQMFLNAYGIKKSNWPYKPPSAPRSRIRILPYPETVRKFFTYKYSKNKYERALYQYMFFFGFMVGVRSPSELCEMKINDVYFEGKNRGHIIITETKKHGSQRIVIPEKAILTSKVHKSLYNWLKSWRPKVANEQSGDALFLQPNGTPFTVRHLGQKLSKMGKKI